MNARCGTRIAALALALTAAALALGCGYLPSALFPWWSFPLALASGALLIGALLLGVGQGLPEESSS